MTHLLLRAALIAAVLTGSTFAADEATWAPAKAPLMTRWGQAVTPKNVWPEYPRPQLVRDNWVNLNGLWDYAVTPKDAAKPDAAAWKPDGILVPFAIESALSGVGRRVSENEALWYRRSFILPALDDNRLLLHFGAVDFHATVFINGREVGQHQGGNVPFTFDITDAVRGRDGSRQELVVRVWDPTDTGSQPRGKQVREPHGIWYTPVTGIWQTVWLETVPWSYVRSVKVTPDVDAGEVHFELDVVEPQPDAGVTIILRDAEGRNRGRVQQPFEANKKFTVKVADPQLWSPDSPHLYSVNINYRGQGYRDNIESYCALRKISLGKDAFGVNRLMLNNQPLFQYGTLDQGWWPDGLLTPPSDEAMAFDLKYLKSTGFNMVRKHIKIEPARLYYHCDTLGLLVWQDMPSGFTTGKGENFKPGAPEDANLAEADRKHFRAELKEMMDWLQPFPSIVVWVPFNEGWGQHDTNAILKWAMDYDPTRLVDGPSGWEDRGFGHIKDMHKYPGPAMFPVMPDRISVLGEFGGLGLPLAGHTWQDSKNWGYRTFKTVEELKEAYAKLMRDLDPLIDQGLAGAIYTQTTDVEIEVNGLLTYDRKVDKMGAAWLKQQHEPLYDSSKAQPAAKSAPAKAPAEPKAKGKKQKAKAATP